jgi:uncharacterized RDD family membrane protein YckC
MSSTWPGVPPTGGGANPNQATPPYGGPAASPGVAPDAWGFQQEPQGYGAAPMATHSQFAQPNYFGPGAAPQMYPSYGSVPGGYGYHNPYAAQSSGAYASAGARVVASIVDSILSFIVALFLIMIGAASGSDGLMALMYVVAIFGTFIVFIGFEATSGATPGKRLLGIKVVKEDGSPMDWGAAIIRNVLRIVDALPFGSLLGFFLMVFHSRKQRVGDMAARTLVVKT